MYAEFRVFRVGAKVVGARGVDHRDRSLSEPGLVVDRGSRVGEVCDDEVSRLYLGDDPVIDVVVVLDPVDTPHLDIESSKNRG